MNLAELYEGFGSSIKTAHQTQTKEKQVADSGLGLMSYEKAKERICTFLRKLNLEYDSLDEPVEEAIANETSREITIEWWIQDYAANTHLLNLCISIEINKKGYVVMCIGNGDRGFHCFDLKGDLVKDQVYEDTGYHEYGYSLSSTVLETIETLVATLMNVGYQFVNYNGVRDNVNFMIYNNAEARCSNREMLCSYYSPTMYEVINMMEDEYDQGEVDESHGENGDNVLDEGFGQRVKTADTEDKVTSITKLSLEEMKKRIVSVLEDCGFKSGTYLSREGWTYATTTKQWSVYVMLRDDHEAYLAIEDPFPGKDDKSIAINLYVGINMVSIGQQVDDAYKADRSKKHLIPCVGTMKIIERVIRGLASMKREITASTELFGLWIENEFDDNIWNLSKFILEDPEFNLVSEGFGQKVKSENSDISDVVSSMTEMTEKEFTEKLWDYIQNGDYMLPAMCDRNDMVIKLEHELGNVHNRFEASITSMPGKGIRFGCWSKGLKYENLADYVSADLKKHAGAPDMVLPCLATLKGIEKIFDIVAAPDKSWIRDAKPKEVLKGLASMAFPKECLNESFGQKIKDVEPGVDRKSLEAFCKVDWMNISRLTRDAIESMRADLDMLGFDTEVRIVEPSHLPNCIADAKMCVYAKRRELSTWNRRYEFWICVKELENKDSKHSLFGFTSFSCKYNSENRKDNGFSDFRVGSAKNGVSTSSPEWLSDPFMSSLRVALRDESSKGFPLYILNNFDIWEKVENLEFYSERVIERFKSQMRSMNLMK